MSNADWAAIQNVDINIYPKDLVEKLLEPAGTCIPNKVVTIRPTDPSWITSHIKQLIRKHKRAYRKARRTGDWHKFKQIRKKNVFQLSENLSKL